jgi:hypothetical protein
VKPQDCPNFQTCNASICPIDPEWRRAAHLPGEKVCHYLLSSGKPGAAEHFAHDPVFAECLVQLEPIRARHRDVAKRIDKAARSGFKSDNLRKRRLQPDNPLQAGQNPPAGSFVPYVPPWNASYRAARRANGPAAGPEDPPLC